MNDNDNISKEKSESNSDLDMDDLDQENIINEDEINTDKVKPNLSLPKNKIEFNKYNLLDKLATTKYNTTHDGDIILYNYLPKDESFKIAKLDYYELIKNCEKKVKIKTLKNVKNFLNIEKNPMNLIPNKNNIDLKRIIAPRLNYLNKQTEIALLEMVKENVQKNKNIEKFNDVIDKEYQNEVNDLNKENEEIDNEE